MKTIHMGRRSSAVAAGFVIAALVATPMAFADDTGTPSPATSFGASTSTEDPSATTTATGTATDTTAPSTTEPTTTQPTTTDSTTTDPAATTTSVPTTPAPPPTVIATAPTPLGSPVVMRVGATGWGVKDLQSRLLVVGRTSGTVDGVYDAGVASALGSFLTSSGLPGDGRQLTAQAREVLRARSASPVVIPSTSSGGTVKELQLRLRAKSLWPYSISGTYSWTLGQKVLAFQRAQNLPQSGVADRRTWSRLVGLTFTPGTFDRYRYEAGLRPLMPTLASLDSRCRTGRVMCVDKATRTLTWVVSGKPTMVMWARFGGPGHETREGTFTVSRRYEYVVSNLYFTPMPYSMFFSGGQAVHYSSNFARIGYAGASHGCVNIGDYAQIKTLYFASRLGDKVVVHH
ncbi:putative peptidoglycan binding protein [Humibacillus xanthopallidus]|uniref:Putative peptidoglycan binding protein n=1 Tax=Humibacillus xanthopallidus TaxID=412689 RepID=A0A543PPY4_9MICO|nr:L,D-transpeptidase family protein [Humibacillus xanthopallidus]TQN46117.1 putative peptidoglycan binding protein [Humibacillus xanthopallidus]